MNAPRRGGIVRELWDVLRANPLESLLLSFAVVAIGSTIGATTAVAVAHDPRDDLTFAGAVHELSRTLKDRGPEQVGAMRRASFVVSGETVVVDTLAVTADSSEEPSFARGGFLRDHVARFNDNVIRAAVREATHERSRIRRRVETGSLFRLVWTDSGTARLSDTADALGLVIRSPYAEGSWRAVRTVDWRSSPALLGYDGQLALVGATDSSRSRGMLNGRDCELRDDTQSRHLVYCTSGVGRAVDRFFDVGFTTRRNGATDTFASMFPYRPRDVWVNGKLERFDNRLASVGTLIELRSTGGFLLSSADWGTLAAEQWINGRMTFLTQRTGTLGYFGRAGRAPRDAPPATTPLTLGFDARLSADVERQARQFLAQHDGVLRRMAVVLMDVRSGEIRAIVEPHRQSEDESLLSFEPVLIGSAVKPMLAAAVIARQPELARMRIAAPDTLVTELAGVPLDKPFHSAYNGCGGPVDVVEFLRCSNNQFAAELVLRSLEHDGFRAPSRPGGRVPRAVLERSGVANGLVQAFDVDPYAGRTSGRTASYWRSPDSTANGSFPVTTDPTLIPWESRPWLLFPKDDGTPVDWIARYAFGGWENRWTLVGAAQAYARIATGRNVQGTFIHASLPPVFPLVAPRVANAFDIVRRGLARVPVDGTARGLAAAFRGPNTPSLTVLAKTGTLNESETGGHTRMKTLAVVVGERASAADDAPLSCGLVAMTYFEFEDEWNRRSDAQSLPSIHLDFMRERLAPVLTRQWRRISGCPLQRTR